MTYPRSEMRAELASLRTTFDSRMDAADRRIEALQNRLDRRMESKIRLIELGIYLAFAGLIATILVIGI
jgi:hypothetical protein